MSQYTTGTASVTQNLRAVAGQGTGWTSQIAAGQLFSFQNENVWYEIASVDSDTALTLKTNYLGATKASVQYAVHRDFTPNNAYPIPAYGDKNTTGLLKETLLKLDAALASLSPVGSLLSGNMTFAGTLTLTGGEIVSPSPRLHKSNAALSNRAGAQTATLGNAPVAGNPAKWVEVDDNGVTMVVPMWPVA